MQSSKRISSVMLLAVAITLFTIRTSLANEPGTVPGQASFKASPTVVEMPAGVSKLYFTYVTDTSMFPAFQRLGAGMIMDSIVEAGVTFPVTSQRFRQAMRDTLAVSTMSRAGATRSCHVRRHMNVTYPKTKCREHKAPNLLTDIGQ